MTDRMLIDSHCHVSAVWYEPVEALLQQMTRVGVAQAVLVQMIGQTDNRYQEECVRRFPGRFASVVWVDPQSPDALVELRELGARGAAGVRLRPLARSPGADPLAIWRCVEDCGLAVSCVGNSSAFLSAEFARVLAEFPKLIVVLEHLGGTSQPAADEAAQRQQRQVMELARFDNVYLKVPGLGELMARRLPLPAGGSPFDATTPAVLLEAIATFGPHRLMWGSDFPPVSSREGYGNSFTLLRQALHELPATALQDMFGNVARRVFKLPRLG